MARSSTHTQKIKNSSQTAQLSLASAAGVIVILIILHIVSPEFDPSWRMVSEYANGDHGKILGLMFLVWAMSSWSLAFSLKSQLTTRVGKIGLFFLLVSGIGEVMAAIFSINHSLHSLASLLGIGGFAIAALFLSKALRQIPALTAHKKTLSILAHLPWICIVVMMISFGLLISTYMQSGADLNAGPVTELPDGVIAVVGWANRALILVYTGWLAYAAWLSLKLGKK